MSDTSETTEVETKTIRVTARWESTHTFEIPAHIDLGRSPTLTDLMDAIQALDETEDIDAQTAELMDWEVSE